VPSNMMAWIRYGDRVYYKCSVCIFFTTKHDDHKGLHADSSDACYAVIKQFNNDLLIKVMFNHNKYFKELAETPNTTCLHKYT